MEWLQVSAHLIVDATVFTAGAVAMVRMKKGHHILKLTPTLWLYPLWLGLKGVKSRAATTQVLATPIQEPPQRATTIERGLPSDSQTHLMQETGSDSLLCGWSPPAEVWPPLLPQATSP